MTWKWDSQPVYEHTQDTVILVSELGLHVVEEDGEGEQVSPFPYRPTSSALPELWPLSSGKAILISVTFKNPSHLCGGKVTDSDITFTANRYCIEYLISQKNYIQKELRIQKPCQKWLSYIIISQILNWQYLAMEFYKIYLFSVLKQNFRATFCKELWKANSF